MGRHNNPAAIRIGLINNMPDSALQSTETQFGRLLEGASAARPVTLWLSSFPELPRGPEALAHIERSYWPLDGLLAEPLDALIVTGTEPRAARLADEPYWHRFAQVLEWAEANTHASIWSCLAAHAAVQSLNGIERRRMAEKRSGVYEHQTASADPLLAGTPVLLRMPHSRWNELSVEELRAAGYQMLSWSSLSGADAFVRRHRSVMLFFQGHPEYEDTTLLKEYRRDVTRFLNEQQPHYPTFPVGYFSPQAIEVLEKFREQALAQRRPELMDRFPFAELAAGLTNTWGGPAVAIYRNWLQLVATAKSATHASEPVSLADS
ncbi:MAG TPA: homoserine O-succinyltransferase [Steroidobacteraceae bacterium]